MLTDKETDLLIRNMYEGSITQDDIERLLSHFQTMERLPKKWEADAMLIRTLAVQAYCAKTQKDFEHKMDRLMARPKPVKRPRLFASPARYAYCAMAALVVGSFAFWNIMLPAADADMVAHTGEMLVYCSNGCPDEQVLQTLMQTLGTNTITNTMQA